MSKEDHLIKILEATARLEEQTLGTRRDIEKLTTHTTTVLATHTTQISSLNRSRDRAKGWLKGAGWVGGGVISILAFFGFVD